MPRTPLLALIAIAFAGCSYGQSRRAVPSPSRASPFPASAQEQQLFALVNRERDRAGLRRLEWNDALAQTARGHVKLLVQHGGLSHQFPGEPSLAERLGATGLRFDASAENVALGPGIEGDHDALMQSAGHRANILDAQYNAIGIGIAAGGAYLYVAENFAHVFPAYSETEFRDAVAAAFNRARRANGVAPVSIRSDDRLRESACARGANTERLAQQLPGVADVAAFTISDPEKLAAPMQKAARAASIRSLSLGICLRPGAGQGYANFWVVAAFSRND
jgi:uncharacterized protein YkwD